MRAVGPAVFSLWLFASSAAAGVAPQLAAPAANAMLGAGVFTALAAIAAQY